MIHPPPHALLGGSLQEVKLPKPLWDFASADLPTVLPRTGEARSCLLCSRVGGERLAPYPFHLLTDWGQIFRIASAVTTSMKPSGMGVGVGGYTLIP